MRVNLTKRDEDLQDSLAASQRKVKYLTDQVDAARSCTAVLKNELEKVRRELADTNEDLARAHFRSENLFSQLWEANEHLADAVAREAALREKLLILLSLAR